MKTYKDPCTEPKKKTKNMKRIDSRPKNSFKNINLKKKKI